MLQVYGFERVAVVFGDLFFIDPQPGKGQEGAERGVRLEVRLLERGELRGTIYSAQPIAVEQPVWRVDLLESVAGPAGSFDRTHHHPRFTDWEPGGRSYVRELSADPLPWLEDRLEHLGEVLEAADVPATEVGEADVAAVAEAAPEIVAAVGRLLDRVRAGEVATPPDGELTSARIGWL